MHCTLDVVSGIRDCTSDIAFVSSSTNVLQLDLFAAFDGCCSVHICLPFAGSENVNSVAAMAMGLKESPKRNVIAAVGYN